MASRKVRLASIILAGLLVLAFAAQALGQAAGSSDIQALLKDLKDSSWQIRWYAVTALGEKKDLKALEPLIERLAKDENPTSGPPAPGPWAR